jgi:hypothetical protein
MGEVNIYGLYVPSLLIQAILAYVLFFLTNKGIDRLNDAGWILFPNIFYLCWYLVCLILVHAAYIGYWG